MDPKRVFRLVSVGGNGNCFFYALWQSGRLRENPIDFSILSFRRPDGTVRRFTGDNQDDFTAFMREMLFYSTSYTDRLRRLGDKIHTWQQLFIDFENTDSLYWRELGMTKTTDKHGTQIIRRDGQLIGVIERRLNAVGQIVYEPRFAADIDPYSKPDVDISQVSRVQRYIMDRNFWANAIEVGICAEFLKEHDILFMPYGESTAATIANSLVRNPFLQETVMASTDGTHYTAIVPLKDAPLTPAARQLREKYSKADLKNAIDLFGVFDIASIEAWIHGVHRFMEVGMPREEAVELMQRAKLTKDVHPNEKTVHQYALELYEGVYQPPVQHDDDPQVHQLMMLDFPRDRVIKALEDARGDMARARDILFLENEAALIAAPPARAPAARAPAAAAVDDEAAALAAGMQASKELAAAKARDEADLAAALRLSLEPAAPAEKAPMARSLDKDFEAALNAGMQASKERAAAEAEHDAELEAAIQASKERAAAEAENNAELEAVIQASKERAAHDAEMKAAMKEKKVDATRAPPPIIKRQEDPPFDPEKAKLRRAQFAKTRDRLRALREERRNASDHQMALELAEMPASPRPKSATRIYDALDEAIRQNLSTMVDDMGIQEDLALQALLDTDNDLAAAVNLLDLKGGRLKRKRSRQRKNRTRRRRTRRALSIPS